MAANMRFPVGRVPYRNILFISLFLFISYVLYILCIHFFEIRKIEIEGEGIQIAINFEKISKNILFFPSQSTTVLLKKRYPQIAKLEIRKKLPDTLQFTIQLRKPVAYIRTDNSTTMVDRFGYVVGYDPVAEGTLPIIQKKEIGIDDKLRVTDGGVLEALKLLVLIHPEIPIQNVNVENSSMYRARSDKTDILIAQNADIEYVAATLQTIFRGVRMKGTIPASIDLRFAKPVIIY
jgi:hypothetical protein